MALLLTLCCHTRSQRLKHPNIVGLLDLHKVRSGVHFTCTCIPL
jgi:hypothetical protein